MVSDEVLRHYRRNQFIDEDVTRATDLSVRGWRELIKLRLVRTETKKLGRGYVRMCDHMVLKRAAVIGTLNRTGLSLGVSGHIALALPFHTLLYEIYDPCKILLDSQAGLNPQTGLPPRFKNPKRDWFSVDKPAMSDPNHDWLLKIYDGRFVGVVYDVKGEPTMFGDLRDDGTSFVAWRPYSQRLPDLGRLIKEFVPLPTMAFAAEWENPTNFSKELESLGYKFERHDENDDPLCTTARASARNPVFSTTVNLTLALRKALRRLLAIDPAETCFETRE